MQLVPRNTLHSNTTWSQMLTLNLYQAPYDLEAPLCDLWLVVPSPSLPQQKTFMCFSCRESKKEGKVLVIMGSSEAGCHPGHFCRALALGENIWSCLPFCESWEEQQKKALFSSFSVPRIPGGTEPEGLNCSPIFWFGSVNLCVPPHPSLVFF